MNLPKGNDAREEVLATMREFSKAMTAGDVDTLLGFYSEDWQNSRGAGKDSLKDIFDGISNKDGSEGTQIDLSKAEAVINGDKVTFTPVTHSSASGRITYSHTLKKEADGVWRLVFTETIDWEKPPLDAQGKKRRDEIEALARASRNLREQILVDPTRPGYHFVMPEGFGAPFDPNGAIYWKGRYHLFYIFQDMRFGKKSDHWGHVSSIDLFHWRHHPTHLLEGMYSGNCFINKDGVPTICYHQVGQGNAMAVALDDDLNEWRKLETNPITPKTEPGDEHHDKYRSWDPFGWVEDDTYYAIFGGGHPGIVKSPALGGEWQYVGDLFAHGLPGVSLDEDVSCAELFKLGDRDVVLCISHRLGCRYYLGEWKNEQFYPDFHAQMSWIDNAFFAPESLQDEKGRRIMWAWLMDIRDFNIRLEKDWSGTMSLPRVLSLDNNGQLLMDVPEEIKALRYNAFSKEDFAVQSGTDLVIQDIVGNSLELFIEMESSEASTYGVKVCVSPDGQEQTSIFYDDTDGMLKIDTRKSGPVDTPKNVEAGPFALMEGERLKLRVFVDKSVVEVFANGRQAVMRFIYPSQPESLGVSLFSTGGTAWVHTLQSWKISPSNPF